MFNATFNISGHIVAVSCIGGGNRRQSANNCMTYFPTCIHVYSGWRHELISTVLTFATESPMERRRPVSDRVRSRRVGLERPVKLPLVQGHRQTSGEEIYKIDNTIQSLCISPVNKRMHKHIRYQTLKA